MLDWRERITSDPAVVVGKPIVKGTRLAVEFVLGLLASGWSSGEIVENYPGLTSEDIQACLLYACEAVRHEQLIPFA